MRRKPEQRISMGQAARLSGHSAPRVGACLRHENKLGNAARLETGPAMAYTGKTLPIV